MRMRLSFLPGVALIAAAPAVAANFQVSVDIPRLEIADYHRPYVAFWIERADQTFVQNLAVWYNMRKKNNEGTQWLKDMRQWWRKSGRELTFPVEGVSGATRAPGHHALSFDTVKTGLDALPSGQYSLVVEAAREMGGREIVRLPFSWPLKTGQKISAQGERELGALSIQLQP